MPPIPTNPVDAAAFEAPLDPWSTVEGSPAPMGATWVAAQQAWNFALHARHATAVTLRLYSPADLVTPIAERSLDPLQHRSGRVWHCRVPAADVPGAAYYAYRVDGPRDRKVWVDDFAGDTSDRRALERRVAAALVPVLTARFGPGVE